VAVRPTAAATTLAAFGALVVLIGANLVAIRIGNQELEPLWHAGFRFLLAAVLFGAIVVATRPSLPDRRAAVGAAAYGLFSIVGFFGFLYAGLVDASVGLATTTLALGPLLTLVLAAAVGLERARPAAIGGGLVAFAGIALMYGNAVTSNVPLTSLVLLVLAAISFAAGAIVVKRTGRMDPVVQNLIASLVGGTVLTALSVAGGERQVLPEEQDTLIAFAYLVVPGTVITFGLLLYLLKRWPASRVSYQFVLAPIVAIGLAAILLAEPIRPVVIVGTALVIAGVWLGALRRTT
jgi:drug/metabolite transporter (DMT)-like permease